MASEYEDRKAQRVAVLTSVFAETINQLAQAGATPSEVASALDRVRSAFNEIAEHVSAAPPHKPTKPTKPTENPALPLTPTEQAQAELIRWSGLGVDWAGVDTRTQVK